MNHLQLDSQTTSKIEVEKNPTDCIAKIMLASALERAGEVLEAVTLYQEVVALDGQGTYGSIAQKALETIKTSGPLAVAPPIHLGEAQTPAVEVQSPRRFRPFLGWFHDLRISHKLLLALIASQLLPLALVGVGAWLIGKTWQNQLSNQAESELSVTEANYNNNFNQIGLDFRERSGNPAIVDAAQAHANGQMSLQLRSQVKQILQNEVRDQNLEYASLIGKDLRIIVSANVKRDGEIFNPNNLVKEVFEDPRQIQASTVTSWAELAKEYPLPSRFANQDALIRYTVTPVRDPSSNTAIAAIVSGEVVNNKSSIVRETMTNLQGGHSGIYMRKPTGEFTIATALSQGKVNRTQRSVTLPNTSLLALATEANGKTVTGQMEVGGQTYTVAAKSLPNIFKQEASGPVPIFTAKPYAILVRGVPETELDALLENIWAKLAVLVLAVIAIDVLLAIALKQAIAEPIKQLRSTAQKFAEGARQARAEVSAADEVGQLTTTFNKMADSIVASEAALLENTIRHEVELQQLRQEQERLQQEIIDLLLEIEEAQQGDLTVQASFTTGEIGSVADAFNVTIRSLRQLVLQVKTVANQVSDLALNAEASVYQFSKAAVTQTTETTRALEAAEKIGQSIQMVAHSAQEAATIGRQALIAAQQGDQTMDQTVASIETIRAAVAATAQKVKRLAESSQEISKIIAIISSISEKTNLLAFNASIEAVRAGENGEGFRVVADEVRRLAQQVTEATKAIEQLVGNIQQETAEVLQAMNSGTAEVVAGTQLVCETKQTLQGLAAISQKIDQYLQAISRSTLSQTDASLEVNHTVEEVAAIAQTTSTEAQEVAVSLQALVGQVRTLQESVSQFRLEK